MPKQNVKNILAQNLLPNRSMQKLTLEEILKLPQELLEVVLNSDLVKIVYESGELASD
jgi:hypothetical protein